MDSVIPEEIKQVSFWDSSKYMNIWIVNFIAGPAGFSSLPFVGVPQNQGVVVQYDEMEAVIGHEAGHFLGLWHVSGCFLNCEDICGNSDSNAMSLGDLVADTPPCFALMGGNCDDSNENTCNEPSPNLNLDEPCPGTHKNESYPKSNRMSEVNGCWSTFTSGQFSRMFYYLNHLQRDLWYPGYIIKKEMIVEEPTKFHRDVNIYDGGRLVINSEIIMAEGTEIIVHQGGQLVVEGGQIRGCDVSEIERGLWGGIKINGSNEDGFDVEIIKNEEDVGSIIEDVDGYAVTAFHSGFFALEPPGRIKSNHTTFNNVDGMLYTLSRFPSNNNSIIENSTQNGGQYGVKTFNGLNIELRRNKFFDIDKECVSSVGGSFDIQGNEFYGGEVDVALTHFTRGQPSFITNNNEFKGNGYGIRASGSTITNHIIRSNTFYGLYDSDGSINDIDVDIYMDGITDYTIQDNVFNGQLGVSSRATFNTSGIVNLVDLNEFIGNRTGLFPHFTNPNYIFSNNCFSTLSRDVSIIGSVPNQGGENGPPANNCFTHQGNPIGNTVRSISGSPEPFDYVDPIENNLDCRMPLLIPANVNVLFTNANPFISCFHSDDEEGASEHSSNGLDFELYDNYSTLSDYIYQEDFEAARQQLNQFDQNIEEENDLHFIANKLIGFYESADGNINQDNDELVQSLKIIALKKHPSSGFAQAYHYYLTGDFVENLDLDILEMDNLSERSSEEQETKTQDEKLTLYPNPTSDILHIENANLIRHLSVYDLMGNSIFESEEVSNISTKEWINGVYIFKISQKNGESITTKILINK